VIVRRVIVPKADLLVVPAALAVLEAQAALI
jgi:hypothetical protein